MDLKAIVRAHSWRAWLGLIARLVLGFVLLVSGLLKVVNFTASVDAVRRFKILPYEMTEIVGYALPIIEIALGILLVVGLFTRIAGAIGAAMMLAFIFGIIWAWAHGNALDCGCFGGGGDLGALTPEIKKGYVWHIVGNTGLTLCGIWLTLWPRTPFALDSWLFAPIPGMDDVADEPLTDTDSTDSKTSDITE